MKYLEPVLKILLKDPVQVKKLLVLESDEEILKHLLRIGKTKEEVVSILEKYYGINYVDLESVSIDPAILKDFKVNSLKLQGILPYKFENSTYYFAISDLGAQELRDNIKYICEKNGFSARFSFAFSSEIKKKFEELENRSLSDNIKVQESSEKSVIEWVNRVIEKGISLDASDIHFEPRENYFQVRYRVDGILSVKDEFNLDENFVSGIITRIKIVSGMDIAEKRKPQDGRIDNFEFNNKKYDIRVSSAATVYGEKLVMRIFNKSDRIMSFSELGISPEGEKKIRDMIFSRQGIVYLAGATGSGKTTTLYTMIETINDDKLNIYTIEDPIERTLKNVNQIQIDSQAGITYASTLRALLRQDPDVIVVGEIRDVETAELAIRASLTGHLVLTTIHANNAIETISRLYNMGIEPYLISTSALGFISQKLVRKLCPHCKEKAEPTTAEKIWLEAIREKYGLKDTAGEFYRAKGCPYCNNIGYKGRTALIEIVTMSDDLRNLIAKKDYISNIYKKALEEGFVPIEVNGYQKALEGITSIEEIMRIL